MQNIPEIISCGYIENKLMYPHKNPGMEIVLVEQGHLEWAVEGVPETLKPGTMFFTLPWQAHGSMHIREPRNKIYFILFELLKKNSDPLKGFEMRDLFGFSKEEQRQLGDIFISARRHAWPASDMVKQLFPELIQRCKSKSMLDASLAVSLLRSMLFELANIITTSPGASVRLSATELKVARFLKALSDCLEHEWTLDEMAATCGIKRTHFSNISRELSGYPPVQYLNRLRFEKACSLLRNTALSITDIGFICGYASSQYFAEAFRRFARMTPSEYRSNLETYETIMQSNWSHPEVRSISDELKRKTAMGLD